MLPFNHRLRRDVRYLGPATPHSVMSGLFEHAVLLVTRDRDVIERITESSTTTTSVNLWSRLIINRYLHLRNRAGLTTFGHLH